jgi:hypothetical protein
MRRAVVAVALLGLLLLASLLLVRQRGPAEQRLDAAQPADAVSLSTRNVVAEDDEITAQSEATREPTAIDLRDETETFRNSTLLFAIRRAGFDCADVVSAHESVEGVWLASCSDVVIYIVTSRGAEQFDVHPVEYRDSAVPFPIRDRDLRSPEPRSIEPQLLR